MPGLGVRDAVIAAASSRFRPIMLTALSTVLGMIPIAPTVFWGPMAFAIMGGLLVATLLTLVFLPALRHRLRRQAGRARARRRDRDARGGMTSTELRDYATVVAATVALLVFIFNVVSQSRNRRIENLTRFNQAHQRLFAESTYLALNLSAFEADAVVRDGASIEMERRFPHSCCWRSSGSPSSPTTVRCRATRRSTCSASTRPRSCA